MSLRPTLLAIVGDSAAGKSTLGAGISALLGDERVTVVTTDDYHRYNRRERNQRRLSALHPDCNDLDLLGEHLEALAHGRPVVKAPYDHATGDFGAPRTITPSEFLIVEGLLGLHSQALRDRYDVSVYLDTPEPLRHRWKLARDIAKRGYSADQVHAILEHRESVAAEYIRPQREHAHMVVRFHGGAEPPDYERLHATVTMRPTLEQPEMQSALDACPRATPAISLTGNVGGDVVLEIDGAISSEQAGAVERALWMRRPEMRRMLLARTGDFIENGTLRYSHALALAQRLIAYPVLRARLSKEAVT
jgi:phosphoribulokinase